MSHSIAKFVCLFGPVCLPAQVIPEWCNQRV